jgi:hypothetical protein
MIRRFLYAMVCILLYTMKFDHVPIVVVVKGRQYSVYTVPHAGVIKFWGLSGNGDPGFL